MDNGDLLNEIRDIDIGLLAGEESHIIDSNVKARVHYEKGNLEKAFTYSLTAISEISEKTDFKAIFSTYMIFASILYAMNRTTAADEIIKELYGSIIKEKNDFLLANLQAFIVKRKLSFNDKKTAAGWLESDFSGSKDTTLALDKIYRYLTTAGALLICEDYDKAVLLCQKIISLSEANNRPMDTIDAFIILSITYRKNKLKRESDEALVKALKIAQKYGFIQSFLSESNQLAAQLGRLSHRLLQPDQKNGLDTSFVKGLYFLAMRRVQQAVETGDIPEPESALSKRQHELVKLLAKDYSYHEISDITGIKFSSIKKYLRTAYHKLGAVNRREAVTIATALGLVED